MATSKAVRKQVPATKKKAVPVRSPKHPNVTLNIEFPICTQEDYGDRLALPEGAVRGHIERKLVPTIKIGKHRFVNVAKLTVMCLEADHDA